jgi:hypothetical protein
VTDDKLPIVFKSGLRTGLICFGCAALGAVAAYAKLSEQYPSSVSFYNLVDIDGRTAGWLFAAFGALLACLGLVAVVRGCPRLTLDETGILFRRCFGSPVRIPWGQFDGIAVRRTIVPGRRVTTVDLAYVASKSGKETCVGNFGSTDKLADTVRRVAARMKAAVPAR